MKVCKSFDLERKLINVVDFQFADESINEPIERDQQEIHPGLCHGLDLRFHKKKHILRAVGLVTLFAVLFNGCRWFEVTLEEEQVTTTHIHETI